VTKALRRRAAIARGVDVLKKGGVCVIDLHVDPPSERQASHALGHRATESGALSLAPSWLFFAFCGPVLWAISVHLDKYLVERFFKDSNVAIMVLFTALVVALALPIIWYFGPRSLIRASAVIALIVLAGILYMTGMLFYLRALQNEEASVVAPFFQTGPLFGYVLAYLVLGETLSPRQLLGGALIIVGALFVSIRFGQSMKMFKTRLAVLMVACGFIMALSSLIFKSLRPEGGILDHDVLDVRRRRHFRHCAVDDPIVSAAIHRAASHQYRGAAFDQRLQRTD